MKAHGGPPHKKRQFEAGPPRNSGTQRQTNYASGYVSDKHQTVGSDLWTNRIRMAVTLHQAERMIAESQHQPCFLPEMLHASAKPSGTKNMLQCISLYCDRKLNIHLQLTDHRYSMAVEFSLQAWFAAVVMASRAGRQVVCKTACANSNPEAKFMVKFQLCLSISNWRFFVANATHIKQ